MLYGQIKLSNAFLDNISNWASSKPDQVGALVGGLGGAGIGYLNANKDNKLVGTFGGGLLGAGAGYLGGKIYGQPRSSQIKETEREAMAKFEQSRLNDQASDLRVHNNMRGLPEDTPADKFMLQTWESNLQNRISNYKQRYGWSAY